MIQTILFFIASFIVALVLLLIVRKAMDDDGPHWAVVVLIMVVAGNVAWFGDAWAKDRATAAETARMLARIDENPVVGAMKATDPTSYAKLVKGLEDSAEAPSDERFERFKTLTQPMVKEFGMTKIRNMNDDVAVKFGAAVGDAMVALGRSRPETCMDEMGRKVKDWDEFRVLLGTGRADDLLHEILYTPTESNPKVTSAEQGKLMLLMSIPLAAAETGIVIDPSSKPTQGELCQLVGTSMKGFTTSLPKSEAGPYVRGFVRGSGTQS